MNLRFAIFSAQWRRHIDHLPRARRLLLGYLLADLNLVVFQKAWPSGRHETGQARYAAGGAVAVWLLWQATSLAGIVLSAFVPLEWGLGVAGTLPMLGIAYALLVDRTAWVAAIVAAAAAVATYSLPLKLNIIVAIAPEIFLFHGHLVDTWRDARLPAALATTLFYAWRPGVLGPMLAGLAVYLPLRLALGW